MRVKAALALPVGPRAPGGGESRRSPEALRMNQPAVAEDGRTWTIVSATDSGVTGCFGMQGVMTTLPQFQVGSAGLATPQTRESAPEEQRTKTCSLFKSP